MPPKPPIKPAETIGEFSDFLLELHKENAVAQSQLRTLLLDFSERLAINELSMKNADAARLLLLENLGRLAEKMDTLRDLPKELDAVAKDVIELKGTVKTHETAFNQLQGGWFVAKISWTALAAMIAFVVSLATHYLMKKVP